MKCYYHKSKDADGECSSCGRPLCRACADYWGGRLCTDCVKSMAAKRRNTALLKILLVLVLTTALFYLLYFTMQGHTAKDMYFALTGFARRKRKIFFLGCGSGLYPRDCMRQRLLLPCLRKNMIYKEKRLLSALRRRWYAAFCLRSRLLYCL